jgi:hypothetical protein
VKRHLFKIQSPRGVLGKIIIPIHTHTHTHTFQILLHSKPTWCSLILYTEQTNNKDKASKQTYKEETTKLTKKNRNGNVQSVKKGKKTPAKQIPSGIWK